jgi:uncharacterized Zn finger protein
MRASYSVRMRAKHVFGLTPWGRFFIESMEALADDGRLARGRSYAGNGSVYELSVKAGVVSAKVEGNYAPYYRVLIRFKPLPDKAVAALRAAFAADALLYARVAAGELPDSLSEGLRAAGVSLMPRRWSEIERSCSCPDTGDPCKHQAAVYYLLAQEIDREPFTLFRLRGIDPAVLSCGATPHTDAARLSQNVPDPIALRLVPPWPEPSIIQSADPLSGLGPLSSYAAVIPAMLPPSRGLTPFDLRVACTAFYHKASGVVPELLRLDSSAMMEGPLARSFAASRFDITVNVDGSTSFVTAPPAFLKSRGLLGLSLLFASCDERDGSPSYRFLRAFFSAMRSLSAACAFVPDVRMGEGRFFVVWKPARFAADVDAMLTALEPIVPMPLTSTQKGGKTGLVPDQRSTVDALASAFFTELSRAIRYALPSIREDGHPVCRALFHGGAVACVAPGGRGLPAALDAWLSVYDMAAKSIALELKVAAADRREAQYRLSAAVVGDDGTRLALHRVSSAVGRADAKTAADALAFAALLSNFVPALGRLGVEPFAELGERDLADFVVEAAPLLARFRVRLILPKELRKLAAPRPALRAKRQSALTSYLDMATAFSFDWTVAIGDERLTIAEFAALVDSGLKLVRWRDQWVRIDPAEAARVLARVSGKNPPGAMEALRTALAGDADMDGELDSAVDFLLGSGRREADDAPVPVSLLAKLRPYQERGYRWMLGNFDRGLGCLLADDMGLGKTVQTIAAILALKEAGRLQSGALVCAPASLLTNWERELSRFAPSLSVCLYYGSSRRLRAGDSAADVTLSSYETWLRDQKKHADTSWSLVVLDEAHYIKNPDTRRAKAIKAIKAERRLALSGTPVENNLSEFWSVFDFALPGYLGSLSRFSAEFRRPIELDRSAEAADRLRRVSAPFIMRRLKTDKSVAADLPDKIVMDEYAILTPEQAALYEAIASDGLARIDSSDPENRLGIVLALITALKQASNHPRNYDKESSGRSERSGKSRLLVALLESAFGSGERVLVFSQYVEMLAILACVVRDELGVEPFILHGGMSKKSRDAQVDGFQAGRGPGVFLVSLKAGGVGLNLTAATRVIHYDLWFNPAVENQATDRAYRIGQDRNVFVHRLITRDTIEERIDAMIASKRELSDMTVRSGESWIADMDNDQLRSLVALR